jgi:uncharacterized membrane protein HdeD (DUF308 family)
MATRSVAVPAAPAERVGTPWWLALMAGVAMGIVGGLLLLAPGLTTIALVRFLGIYWLIDGILRLVSLFVDRSGWIWKVASGLLGILAGLAIMEHPILSAMLVPAMLVVYVGITGIVLGMLEVIMAFRGAGWATGILGAASIALGLLLLLNPLAGALALPMTVGALALAGGIVTVISSLMIPFLVRSSAS